MYICHNFRIEKKKKKKKKNRKLTILEGIQPLFKQVPPSGPFIKKKKVYFINIF